MERILTLVAGAVVVLLTGLVLARLLRLDDRYVSMFVLQTLVPWLLLPAYGVLAFAALARRPVLAAVAAGLVACHLVWTWPDRPWRRSQPPTAGSPITLASVNAYRANPRPADLGRALLRLDADVLVVQELSPWVRDALVAAGIVERFPHCYEDVRPDFYGSGIYSRLPLRDGRVVELAGFPVVRAILEADAAPVELVVVHTRHPLAGLDTLRRQLQDLRQLAMAAAAEGHLILAGDFNATRQHRPFRRLLDTGLRDVHVETGRGLARTWPQGWHLPPFALLDHVLVSGDIGVAGVAEAPAPGSDHRGVVAHLRLPEA